VPTKSEVVEMFNMRSSSGALALVQTHRTWLASRRKDQTEPDEPTDRVGPATVTELRSARP
jgi:hypothetical protein